MPGFYCHSVVIPVVLPRMLWPPALLRDLQAPEAQRFVLGPGTGYVAGFVVLMSTALQDGRVYRAFFRFPMWSAATMATPGFWDGFYGCAMPDISIAAFHPMRVYELGVLGDLGHLWGVVFQGSTIRRFDGTIIHVPGVERETYLQSIIDLDGVDGFLTTLFQAALQENSAPWYLNVGNAINLLTAGVFYEMYVFADYGSGYGPCHVAYAASGRSLVRTPGHYERIELYAIGSPQDWPSARLSNIYFKGTHRAFAWMNERMSGSNL